MKRSTNNDIDRLVRDYYEGLRLDNDKINHLLSLSTSSKTSESARTTLPQNMSQKSDRRRLLIAACVGTAFVATGALYTVMRRQNQYTKDSLGKNIQLVTELITNHNNQSQLDVLSPSIEKIANQLNEVSFQLQLPDQLLARADIIGGRYCSLLGEKAIQVRLKDAESNKIITAFVTQATDKLNDFDGVHSNTEELAIAANRHQYLFIATIEQR